MSSRWPRWQRQHRAAVLGLVISIPLVVFGATMLMKIMESYPVIITCRRALSAVYVYRANNAGDPTRSWSGGSRPTPIGWSTYELFTVLVASSSCRRPGWSARPRSSCSESGLAGRKPPGPEGPESAARP